MNGTTDGTKLQEDWFPQVDSDIFISHSHKDIKLAQGLAGWLNQKFGLKCFIDANIWGYADELLEMINSKYSDKREDGNDGYLYNHTKCNTASKHVNVMLSIALQKMIDKTEAIFVLNTDNFIQKYGEVYKTGTYSPWIYTEIVCTELIRKKPLSEYRKQFLYEFAHQQDDIHKSYNESEYSAVYKVSIDHLKDINMQTLFDWEKNNTMDKYKLDKLYLITHPEQMKKIKNFYENKSSVLIG
ncbi:toll/interleukin-1 receptor domain-containing protein [Clostridium beijerinckii]|uniref:TIR domain-containing protein n=2 Tax=Clostridium beijerinckii TaxID=1520 RepID=A0AAW3WDC9_CLOBE|nr:toll/interleukin-1 receptor domain-containing protein [Clostridium beijerinckii]MBC2459331.1 hypothetical protein [Clostridium beijerinckii]MBC2476862.1 hypothetical protein [Clostridium beijerinckii]NOV59864.1 hypothetical protein [Clostridium beijerinckii]NOV71352.1 hypothetical protein [Clostridium beijerinckii]NOW34278.1 hypothetical protein [Clostridium beijerinckii]